MFADLNHVLDLSPQSLERLSSQVILALDVPSTDVSFVPVHFASLYARSNAKVILFAAEQSFFHYTSVFRKLGINLANEIQQGKVVYINGLSQPYSWSQSLLPSTTNTVTYCLGEEPEKSLQELYFLFKVYFFLDCLSELLNHCTNIQQLVAFIQYLKRLASGTAGSSVVLLYHHCEGDTLTESTLCYASDIVLRAQPLATGFQSQVFKADGQVSVEYIHSKPKQHLGGAQSDASNNKWLYALSENNLSLTPIVST